MEIRNLKTFLQVVESGSFTKAAQALGYTQAAVSLQINQLEEELNCSLFDRIGHKIYLTNRGELLHEYALKIKYDLDSLEDAFSKEEVPAGQVRLCTADSICEKMMLLNYADFHHAYPGIHLIFSTGSTTDLVDVLEKNDADAIFTLDKHIKHPVFINAAQSPVRLCFATSVNNPLAKKEEVSLEEILEYPLLLTERNMSYGKLLDECLLEHSLQASPVLETGRTDIILKYVVDGIGITFLPEFVIREEVENGTIAILNVKGVDLTIWKQLLYRKDKWMTRAFQAFLDFVISHEFEW